MEESHAVQEQLDQRHLQTTYEHDLRVVYRFIFTRVGNREETERLTARVFLSAIGGGAAQADRPAKILTWLLQLAQALLADREYSAYHR